MIKNILLLALFASTFSVAQNYNSSNKSVNIKVNGLPPQYTSLRVDTLSRCIQKLSGESTLQAVAEGRTEYLKRISGTDKNDYVKVWTASVQIPYTWKYKLLYLLVPQGGLETQPPVFREVEGTFPVSETIDSNSEDSDYYAFSNPRKYFFNSQERAQQSALARAKIRFSQLKSLECSQ